MILSDMENKIINADCMDILKQLPDKCIDMILCDLPYGTTACKWDTIIPFAPLWEQYKRIVKDNAAIVLFGSEPFSSFLRMSNIEMYKYDWIWKKSRPTGFAQAKNQPMRDYETISCFSKGSAIHACQAKVRMNYNPQGTNECHILKHQSSNNGKTNTCFSNRDSHKEIHIQEQTNYPRQVLEVASESNTIHPTQKPVALFEYLIKTYTNENDLVLDNCSGSGTTAIACMHTKRRFICIEKDPEYWKASVKRLEDEQRQGTLF